MIAFSLESSIKPRKIVDLLVLPFHQETKGAKPAFVCPIPDAVKPALSSGDFTGKEGEIVIIYTPSKTEKRVLLLGLGEKKFERAESFRKMGGKVAKLCRKKNWTSMVSAFPNEAFAEGLLLGSYVFKACQAKKEICGLQKVSFSDVDKDFLQKLKRLEMIVSSVNLARELVNRNADDINADAFVAEARKLATDHPSLKLTVLRKKELERESMGLMLAVNRASLCEPALIIFEYRGDPKNRNLTALVGKGVVYDTGGLNLKASGMETMKCDMAGAASVLAIMRAASCLKIPVNLVGVLGVVENAIGPASYKAGDAYKSRSGKIIEISNTDAEGRLVLADAISYVQDKFSVEKIIDFATLTGGAVIALGEEFSALFSNDETLAKDLSLSGEKVGDPLWRMPLSKGYLDMLKSNIVDLKNSAGKKASPCTAAAFLQSFIKSPLPWAHLDIAGTAFFEEPKGYHCSQATGVGVRLIIDFLCHPSSKERKNK